MSFIKIFGCVLFVGIYAVTLAYFLLEGGPIRKVVGFLMVVLAFSVELWYLNRH